MAVPRKYWQKVIDLPDPRDVPKGRHHLFWPAADMRQRGLAEFSTVGCTSAHGMDSMVHSVIHQGWAGVLNLGDSRHRHRITRLANAHLERHLGRDCACYHPKRLITLDALNINRAYTEPPSPCTGLIVDEAVAEIMQQFYRQQAPFSKAVRRSLARRCHHGLCNCQSEPSRQPLPLARTA